MIFHVDQSGHYETFTTPGPMGTVAWWFLRFRETENSLRHNSVGTKMGGMYALDAKTNTIPAEQG
jgi:hypothetical protein